MYREDSEEPLLSSRARSTYISDGRIVAVVRPGQSQGESPAAPQAQQIQVVLNWFEDLESNVHTK